MSAKICPDCGTELIFIGFPAGSYTGFGELVYYCQTEQEYIWVNERHHEWNPEFWEKNPVG